MNHLKILTILCLYYLRKHNEKTIPKNIKNYCNDKIEFKKPDPITLPKQINKIHTYNDAFVISVSNTECHYIDELFVENNQLLTHLLNINKTMMLSTLQFPYSAKLKPMIFKHICNNNFYRLIIPINECYNNKISVVKLYKNLKYSVSNNLININKSKFINHTCDIKNNICKLNNHTIFVWKNN
jgi:hypothetical protein